VKIAILSPVWFPVPPTGYGGIEWVVSLLADGLVDRLLVFVAPVLAGDGVPMLAALPEPLDLPAPEVERVGADILLSWRLREA